ncbi:hypothetical protein H9P43_006145 [Blastocladiella emersonii ATCC 22665]|nr:hypothetical protein H9P43_006145 [Blastocladiella emersonii ATCC 22665]
MYRHVARLAASSAQTRPALLSPSCRWSSSGWSLRQTRVPRLGPVPVGRPVEHHVRLGDTGRVVEAAAAKHAALATFLPHGYPASVAPGYLRYTQWSFVHSVAGTVTGVLSMQSLLYAIGLGAGSIPLAAALNWVIKDGLGQLGGVVYASVMGEKFDSEPKRLRLTAAAAMQAASFLELITPLVPHLFLPIASISNIGKNIAWLASSATRAQINQTFAVHDNLGDVTGKAGSQATAAGVLGTGLGIVVSARVGTDFGPLLAAFLPFSALNLWAMVQSNRTVITRTLNAQRIDLVVADWAAGRGVPSPEAVAEREGFVRAYVPRVSVNPPLAAAESGGIEVAPDGGFAVSGSRVWIAAGADAATALRGYAAAAGATDTQELVAAMHAAGWHTDSVYVDQDVDAVELVKVKVGDEDKSM